MTLRHRRGLATARLGLSYSPWLAESYQVYCFLPVTSALHLIYFRRAENKGSESFIRNLSTVRSKEWMHGHADAGSMRTGEEV